MKEVARQRFSLRLQNKTKIVIIGRREVPELALKSYDLNS